MKLLLIQYINTLHHHTKIQCILQTKSVTSDDYNYIKELHYYQKEVDIHKLQNIC